MPRSTCPLLILIKTTTYRAYATDRSVSKIRSFFGTAPVCLKSLDRRRKHVASALHSLYDKRSFCVDL
jgi:hypothetical protein